MSELTFCQAKRRSEASNGEVNHGGVAALGYFAFQRHDSAYVVGMVLYALDGLLCLVAGVYLAAGFHLFVLWSMWRGLSASRELLRLSSGDQVVGG
jgi:hypothetical protein